MKRSALVLFVSAFFASHLVAAISAGAQDTPPPVYDPLAPNEAPAEPAPAEAAPPTEGEAAPPAADPAPEADTAPEAPADPPADHGPAMITSMPAPGQDTTAPAAPTASTQRRSYQTDANDRALRLNDTRRAVALGLHGEARTSFEAGMRALREGRSQQALLYIRRVYRLSNNNPQLLFPLAVAHDRIGNTVPAQRAYSAFVQRAPTAPEVPEARRRLQALGGEVEVAAARPSTQTPPEAVSDVDAASPGSSNSGSTNLSPAVVAEQDVDPQETETLIPTLGSESGETQPIYERAWFWLAAGGVVILAAIIVGVAASGSSVQDPVPPTLGPIVLALEQGR